MGSVRPFIAPRRSPHALVLLRRTVLARWAGPTLTGPHSGLPSPMSA